MNNSFRNTVQLTKFGVLSRLISCDQSALLNKMPKKNVKKSGSSDTNKPSESSAKTEAIELDKHGNILINVHCKPGSTKNMIKGIFEYPDQPRLDMKIHSRAVEGQANDELLHYLAEVLDIRKSDFKIIHGLKSREKTLTVSKDVISLDEAKEKVNKEIALTKAHH